MPDMDVGIFLSKGNILEAIDNASGTALSNIREALTAGGRVEEVAQANLDLSNDATRHLKDDWFSDDGWFGFDTTEIIRAGFIHAINVSSGGPQQQPTIPLDCYWISAGDSTDGSVKVAVRNNGSRVVVMIRTPQPQRPPTVVGTNLQDESFSVVVDAQQPPVTPQYREI